jgi:hypothetical protein
MSAGKGDKLRKGENLNSYWENYDQVFRKRKTVKEWQSFLSLKIENYDGFREYNSDDLLTEQEFKKCLNHENH